MVNAGTLADEHYNKKNKTGSKASEGQPSNRGLWSSPTFPISQHQSPLFHPVPEPVSPSLTAIWEPRLTSWWDGAAVGAGTEHRVSVSQAPVMRLCPIRLSWMLLKTFSPPFPRANIVCLLQGVSKQPSDITSPFYSSLSCVQFTHLRSA